eukprot:2337629-Pyramimonas_sp.AAC.1
MSARPKKSSQPSRSMHDVSPASNCSKLIFGVAGWSLWAWLYMALSKPLYSSSASPSLVCSSWTSVSWSATAWR